MGPIAFSTRLSGSARFHAVKGDQVQEQLLDRYPGPSLRQPTDFGDADFGDVALQVLFLDAEGRGPYGGAAADGRALSRLMQSAYTDSHRSPRSCGRARRSEVVRFPREIVECLLQKSPVRG